MTANPADAVREAPTELDRIIAEMRADGTVETLYHSVRMTYYADRLAALAGAAPVAWAYRSEDPYDAGQWMLAGPTWEGEARPNRREVVPLFTHAPAKAREDWQPIATAPKDAPWWLVWSSLYQMPVVVTRRMDDGTFWDGDWDRDVQANHWLPLSGPAALATFAEGE